MTEHWHLTSLEVVNLCVSICLYLLANFNVVLIFVGWKNPPNVFLDKFSCIYVFWEDCFILFPIAIMKFFRLVLPNNIKQLTKCCPLWAKPCNSLRKFTLFVSLMIIINWKSCVVLCYGSLPSLWGQNRLRQKREHKSAGLTRWITHRTRRRNPIINGKGRKRPMPAWERSSIKHTSAGLSVAQSCVVLGVTWNSGFSQQLHIIHGSQIARCPQSYSREDNLSSVQAHRVGSERRPFFYSFSYSSLALFWP